MYKRVLLKLSGEALMGDEKNFDPKVIHKLALEIKEAHEKGCEIAIVVGGGNFIRGKVVAELGMDRVQGDYMGMLGTIINALAIQASLEDLGVDTRVMTSIDMERIAEPYIQRRAIRHLEKGRIVIFGGGTGNPFFSTDTASALRANEIKAEAILMGKNGVDGIYSADPDNDPNAIKYDHITYSDIIAQNLKIMDLTAVSLCQDNNTEIIVFSMNEEGNIVRVIQGERIGTIVNGKDE